jgi:hypothetical protein
MSVWVWLLPGLKAWYCPWGAPNNTRSSLLTGYKLGGMLCFLIFMDNLLRWMERGGNSAWFWLCSGKLEVVFLFGLFSLVAQFLYWSEIVGDLNEQQAER